MSVPGTDNEHVGSFPGTFHWPVRVYYEDTDAMRVVYYANYLRFFERARTEWLREAGVSQSDLARNQKLQFVVKNVNIDYIAPAIFDDKLDITLNVRKLGRSSVVFYHEVLRVADSAANRDIAIDNHGPSEHNPAALAVDAVRPLLLATSEVIIVCVGTDIIRPRPIPDGIVKKLETILIHN